MGTFVDTTRYDFNDFLSKQAELEKKFSSLHRKNNGAFLTSNLSIINSVLFKVPEDERIFSLSYLEPSCGHGAFLIALIIKAYIITPKKEYIQNFIQDNLYFIDIDPEMVSIAENNIRELFFFLFGLEYSGNFNSYVSDFTLLNNLPKENDGEQPLLLKNIDFVIGNPPYVTLYGRRDKKRNEGQRVYYLQNYSQFPQSLKNGKINYIMLFIERGLQFLRSGGYLSFVVDISFFETAFMYCRKYLVEKYTIELLMYNYQGFDGVASGQIILVVKNKLPDNNSVIVVDSETSNKVLIEQASWNTPSDEYKFRISHCQDSNEIINEIMQNNDPILKEIYPRKNLRTCTMLLNMEDKFTSHQPSIKVKSYPYYRGSNGLKYKYSQLHYSTFFNYDKNLQDEINEKLKEELTRKGIKNKKRIGLGETAIYDNPKVYIRQSAKELIASYDEHPSAANNSLYVFSLRDSSEESILFLKFFCGIVNSKIYTFFAQKRRIIRYNKGKQPQIKISDLYQIPIPQEEKMQTKIANLVSDIYKDPKSIDVYKAEIDSVLYSYYSLTSKEIKVIERAIESFLG